MTPLVHVVDDDDSVRDALGFLLRSAPYAVETYPSAAAFLAVPPRCVEACLLTDIRMPGMDGLDLQKTVTARFPTLPVIIMTGHGDVPLAVRAMRAGALDFLEKPFEDDRLFDAIARALAEGRRRADGDAARRAAEKALAQLTPREAEVFALLADGEATKAIAIRLGISPRTAEVHRLRVMEKMQARSVADLARSAFILGRTA